LLRTGDFSILVHIFNHLYFIIRPKFFYVWKKVLNTFLVEQGFFPFAESSFGVKGPIKCGVAGLKTGIFWKFFDNKPAERPIYIIVKSSERFFLICFQLRGFYFVPMNRLTAGSRGGNFLIRYLYFSSKIFYQHILERLLW